MKRWIPLACAAIGLLPLACSKAIDPVGGGAGPTGAGPGGTGGATSAASSGGAGGGMVDPGPCGVDCSTIFTPQCLQSVCDEATGTCTIVTSPTGEPCDDGQFCTVGETCDGGVCGGGATNACGLTAPDCGQVVCSEGAEECHIIPQEDGTSCAAGDLCEVNATCQGGECVGVPKDCFFFPVPDSCKVATCNPETGNCEAAPGNEGAACSDSGDLCMVGKTCQGGLCLGGTPKDCSSFDAGCNTGSCDAGTGQCYAVPVAAGGLCAESTDACNVGVCNDAGQCVPIAANDGAACSDGNACTFGETCLAGACQGGQTGGYAVYFTETFASNAAGWTFTPGTKSDGTTLQEWAIGPATASTGSVTGNHDPATDTTPTADNGIAGVVIGGTITKVIHTANYIESPVINTDVPGPVYLEFQRWLNSDYTPYMQNFVEVYNGTSWVVVWQTGSSPAVRDSQWQKQSYDITAHKSANMKVRFGFSVGSTGVFTVTSWNIDDVVIANAVCN